MEVNNHEQVAPARERGLKLVVVNLYPPTLGRSREGAWIEMSISLITSSAIKVAPARERGLKYLKNLLQLPIEKSLPRGSVD